MNNRILKALFPLLLAAISTPALAVQSVDQSRDARANGSVEITVVRGEFEVRGWAENKVQVKGDLDEYLEAFTFEVDGSRTRIKVDLKEMESMTGGEQTRLEISVPRGSRVATKGVSTNQTIRDISGDVAIKSVSGELELEKLSGAVDIKGVSGDVKLVGGNGPTQINLISGNVQADLAGGDARLSVVSGDLTLRIRELSGLSVSSVSGTERVHADSLSGSGVVGLSTLSGDIELNLPAGADASFELKSGIGGEIENDYSADRAGDSSLGNTLRFVTGNGSVPVSAKTMSGTVRLRKH
ncbi:MAG: DUF4097 domain-containing protein [Gammaproteobacteria bacterium]|nr:DUF4097 domain-containing protein [Gammaproteobacteria bacterium]